MESFGRLLHMFIYIVECESRKGKSMESKSGRADCVRKMTISLLTGYLITLAGILVMAMLLLFFQISEDFVNIGIIVIYVLSSFGAGFMAGKQLKTRKFLWGMLNGGIYYMILVILSLISKHSPGVPSQELITSFFLCLGGGTLGGMLCP